MPRPVSIQDAAYAAGFFDGEGWVSIVYVAAKRTINKQGRVYFHERYSLVAGVSQNDRMPLDWLAARFGGHVRFVRGKRSYDEGYYQRWDWKISTTEAVSFLYVIRPFLIVKARQADIAFDFAETMRNPHEARKLKPETQEKRRVLYAQMKEEKHAFRVASTA